MICSAFDDDYIYQMKYFHPNIVVGEFVLVNIQLACQKHWEKNSIKITLQNIYCLTE